MRIMGPPCATRIGTLKPDSNTTGVISVSPYSANMISDVRSSSTVASVSHVTFGFLRISARGIPLVCAQGFSITLNKE